MKLLPFVNKPAEEVESVGSESTGLLYLVKKRGVTPNENPSDFQEQRKKQQTFLLKLNKRIKHLAQQEGVSVAEMRKRVMGADAPENKSDQPKVEVVDDDARDMFDYLDDETASLLFDLQEDKAQVAIKAATFMLQYRVLYPITVAANAVAGSTSVAIEALTHPIEPHTSIRFAGVGGFQYLETSEMVPVTGDPTQRIAVESTLLQLKDGDLGFVCRSGSRQLRAGYPDWTENDTRTYLPEEMIAALFNFYQWEANGGLEPEDVDGEEEEQKGNLLTPSKTPSELPA